jgi:hypothetical protein
VTLQSWTPQIEARAHPFGEQGVRSSLEEVARRAARGGSNPRVRTWSTELLDRARRRGEDAKSDRGRATVLLRAVQQKLYVPDPVGTEYMPGAHLLACDVDDENGVCVKAGDCDDLCILLGACFLSVGLHTMIVGHAYNRERNIQHVLLAVRINGTWLYADPITNFPLGKCVPFTRERLLSVPNVKVICDDNVCLTDEARNYDPEQLGFVAEGLFVGVDGLPGPPPVEWLGQTNISQQTYAGAREAATKEAAKHPIISKESAIKIGEAAGAGAGAAACVAASEFTAGVSAAAAPLCAAVGGAIGGWVANVVTGAFEGFAAASAPSAKLNAYVWLDDVIWRFEGSPPTVSASQRTAHNQLFKELWYAYFKHCGETDKTCLNTAIKAVVVELNARYASKSANEALRKAACDHGQLNICLANLGPVAAMGQGRRPQTSAAKTSAAKPLLVTAAIGGLLWWLLA